MSKQHWARRGNELSEVESLKVREADQSMGQIRGITEKKIYKTSKRRVRVIYFKVGEIFLPSYLPSGITFAQVTHNFLKQLHDPGNV